MRYFTTGAQRAQRKEFHQKIFRAPAVNISYSSLVAALPRCASAVKISIVTTDER